MALNYALRYAGIFEEPSGYGQAARAHLAALSAAGVEARPHPLRSTSRKIEPGSGAAFCRGLPKPFARGDEPVALFHTMPEAFAPLARRERLRVGVTVWEAPKLPRSWVAPLSAIDEIWVPSEFSARSFREASSAPVAVIPHPIKPFEGERAPYPGLPDDRFLFLSVFEWHERKNPTGLLRAFRRAFQGSRDVALVLKVGCHFGKARDEIRRELARMASGGFGPLRAPDIHVIWHDLSAPLIERLFLRADAYVSLHRTEGFGLCMAQAMAAGKPVVASAYSANLEYMNNESAFLVPGRLVPVRAEAWQHFDAGATWYEADEGAAVEALRACASRHAERERRALRGRERVSRDFAPGRVGRLMLDRLSRLDV